MKKIIIDKIAQIAKKNNCSLLITGSNSFLETSNDSDIDLLLIGDTSEETSSDIIGTGLRYGRPIEIDLYHNIKELKEQSIRSVIDGTKLANSRIIYLKKKDNLQSFITKLDNPSAHLLRFLVTYDFFKRRVLDKSKKYVGEDIKFHFGSTRNELQIYNFVRALGLKPQSRLEMFKSFCKALDIEYDLIESFALMYNLRNFLFHRDSTNDLYKSINDDSLSEFYEKSNFTYGSYDSFLIEYKEKRVQIDNSINSAYNHVVEKVLESDKSDYWNKRSIDYLEFKEKFENSPIIDEQIDTAISEGNWEKLLYIAINSNRVSRQKLELIIERLGKGFDYKTITFQIEKYGFKDCLIE